MTKQKLVVTGAGMASGRVLEHLSEADPDGFEITIFNAEPRGNNNRIMLSPVLSGDKTCEDIVTHDAAWYAARGITTRFGEHVLRIDRQKKVVEGVLPEDNSGLEADLVVMAVGIRPETRLATTAGLEVARGIEVNAQMQTLTDPDISAVGECVEFNGHLFGLVAPLYDQAKVLARTLLGQSDAFVVRDVATKLKVTGCDLFSAGDFAEAEGREDIVFRDPARGICKRLVIEGDRLVGAVMYGDTGDGNWFFGLIKDETDIEPMRETLIFGPAFQGGAAADPLAAVAALSPEAEICGCNGVCKGTIVAAIERGAGSLAAVRTVTRASASCGTCTGLVGLLLQVTLGDAFKKPVAQPICGCTSYTHEQLRRLIKAVPLKSQQSFWQDWAGARATAAMSADRRSTSTCWPIGRWTIRTTRSAGSSTNASTPTSRRTAPSAWCRACATLRRKPRRSK